ncbi:Alpha amylase protein [Prosthecochloris sp. CIB 2401]|nr:Alpha amylase protein [Prosthecochloris sp. CIB 2401]
MHLKLPLHELFLPGITAMPEKTDSSFSQDPIKKEHFYLTRRAREACPTGNGDPLSFTADIASAYRQSEETAHALSKCMKKHLGKEAKPLLPAQFHAMKLLHAASHLIMSRLVMKQRPDLMRRAEELSGSALGTKDLKNYAAAFVSHFPPSTLLDRKCSPETFAESAHLRETVLEESFLVWLQNLNPALDPFSFLISDDALKESAAYQTVTRTIMESLRELGPIGPGGKDPAELLTMPMRHAPHSLLEQLRFIRIHWGELLASTPLWDLIDEGITHIEDEDRYLFFETIGRKGMQQHGGWFEKQAQVPSFTDLGDAPENYSADLGWMPCVVMLAKSTFVWLDQLRKTYHAPIYRLQDIPDAELEQIGKRGFNTLWLIGLWERSEASMKIKQMQGNSEAKASAYALDRYNIADELGGYDGYLNLRDRAARFGVRLASDMVPNHTGMDSRQVMERPDMFIHTHQPPYHNYTYNGPNLSSDPRYGIYLEDGYWDRSDAAVTFKRVDFETGDTRYIYHGNDGTSMPWNDTAQLDFLKKEVREAVIQEILHVARMFPVIRFDAAMVLVKKHIQRLWYPMPGHSPGVPSRGNYALGMEDFNRFIPEEFWREVVDRIHQEVPDTLLLAEAFWMLEGYFVRTLGMHRVYNSAFMHMLKKEDNANYRYLIKNTLEYDAQILKRYVNFMNNPDEDTAIAQFGKGDKYFGVCVMLSTLPGLPMFGHGQVEGFSEKYGMEYARAYHDEHPDSELVARHEREIFPLLKKRYLFAEVENFHLYDVYSDSGSVNENIFCYSNRYDTEKALVAYNNSWEHAAGWARMSVGFKTENGIEQRSLTEGLGLSNESGRYVIFRDHLGGLEYIRSIDQLRHEGLYLGLNGYGYNVFFGFREVIPTKLRPYDRLCSELEGRGVTSVEEATLEMSLAPLHERLREFCTTQNLERLLDISLTAKDQVLLVEEALEELLAYVTEEIGNLIEQGVLVPDGAAEESAILFSRVLTCSAEIRSTHGESTLAEGLGAHEEFSAAALIWTMLKALQEMMADNGLLERNIIDDLLLQKPLKAICATNDSLTNYGCDQLPHLFCSMLQLPSTKESKPAPADELLKNQVQQSDEHMQKLLRLEEMHNRKWFRQSGLERLLAWDAAIMMAGMDSGYEDSDLEQWVLSVDELCEKAFLAGYSIESFIS